MNNATLYNKTNTLQKRDADEIMKEFSNIFEGNAKSELLDVGCGAGNVLVEIILPKINNKSLKVTGIDISKKMVKYASEKYHKSFIKFLNVDIESDFVIKKTIKGLNQNQQELCTETFDIITSFYCLHWVQNQRQAISNIYKLLKPNGTCLLAFLVSNPIFDIYLNLSRMKKYATYMNDVKQFVSPYHFEKEPLEVFSKKLYDVGFNIIHIDIRDQVFIFDDIELLKHSVKAVNPFSSRMSENLQNDFLDDYIVEVDKLNLIQFNENTFCKTVITPYKLMVAVASK
ncbi:CLUMA_CG000045, isoform A [Clunio marinus]|uniref:CLUMA_CG000045, isoform A n=1 Tax=Clunio marinus TaxID=568069 RepID=A0A1J1HJD8_9DIPT|nr:CLUMA_CG000045, isoform A [Clunio marinus]